MDHHLLTLDAVNYIGGSVADLVNKAIADRELIVLAVPAYTNALGVLGPPTKNISHL